MSALGALFYETERWMMADEQVREVAPHTYLLTCTLHQGDRVTRRLTVWQGSAQAGWKVLYHQGTALGHLASEDGL